MRREELEQKFNAAPFVANLGIRLVSLGSGTCETELDVEPRHLQQDGFVHAGVQATMADHTAGGAAATMIEPDHIILTAEFKINLLRAAKGDQLTCRSKVLKPGSRLIIVESEVQCENEGTSKLVSKTTVSIAVIAESTSKPCWLMR
ncbi:MAG: PaaI family thioesterase [Proteobacteria bacterium]|nr:PaaI family thioesterase [Pseudomonadota bacterium]